MANWGQTFAESFNGALQNSQKLAFDKWQQQQDFALKQQQVNIQQRESNTNNAMMMLWLKNQGVDLTTISGAMGPQGNAIQSGMPSQQPRMPPMPQANPIPPGAMMSMQNGQYGSVMGKSMGAIMPPMQGMAPSNPTAMPQDNSSNMFANMVPSMKGGKFGLTYNTQTLNSNQADQLGQQLVNGTLSPSQLQGRGLSRTQALLAAQKIDPTYNAAQADVNYFANKAGATGMEKLYNNVKTFHDTFRKNADVALDLSDKFDRSQVPLLNEAILKGQNAITGNPEASRMLTAINTVAAEYARLTNSPGASGSVISDSARHEAQGLLSAWMNQGQIRGLLDPESGIMSIDANNRLQALEDRRNATRGNSSSSSTSSSSPSSTSTDVKSLKSKYGLL